MTQFINTLPTKISLQSKFLLPLARYGLTILLALLLFAGI